ncbi:M48 family metallopeptidase [Permianibacter sp. IMCC34836]|uniref:beta-barrel assembly-enhancing protease n=1 Tax=Permianibacter fluminis TaxID=2738515 RepID=UPI001553E1F5|nr:M48 family metalloprotease [Permianibacter fluminis]NQD38330.1 M48 family metallopeptidase [Permianibacter fluminis]
MLSELLRSRFAALLAALALTTTVATVASAANDLPDIGSSVSKTLSLTQEQLIGDDYMRQIRQFAPIIDDPEIVEYINDLGFRLVASAPDATDRQFYFFVLADPELNAFALPGGYIGVHSALILMADNESELAGVMAHETAHVIQRHLARRVERQQQLSLPTLAAIIGGLIMAANNPQAGIAAMTAAQAGATQVMINHTRENEAEADRIGIQILADVSLDPNGMASFFEKMAAQTRYMQMPPPVLLTHPVSEQRMADARLRAAEMHPHPVSNSLRFRLMQAKLRDLTQTDLDQREREQVQAEKLAEADPVVRYSRALLSLRRGELDTATRIASQLMQQEPSNLSYLLLQAQVLRARQNFTDAEQLLGKALALHPNHHALTVAYSQVLLDLGKADRARERLLAYVSLPDTEPNVYRLLASAQNQAGKTDEVHESQGLYLQAVGDLSGAIQQFELARRSRSDDPYASTRIQARIQHLQNILLERRRRR